MNIVIPRAYLALSLISLLLILVFFLNQAWAPSYPVEGQIFFRPNIYAFKAPFNALIKHLYIQKGDVVRQGQRLLDLANINDLYADNFWQQTLLDKQQKAKHFQKEMLYQHKQIQVWQTLYQKKLIAEQDFHQKQQEYQSLILAYQEVLQDIKSLKHEHQLMVQAPITGQMMDVVYQQADKVGQGKILFRIQPLNSQTWIKLKLSAEYRPEIFIGQSIKLTMFDKNKHSDLPLEASVRSISATTLQSDDKHFYFWVYAQLKTTKPDLYSGMPLRGYALGQRQKIWTLMKKEWF